jgi:hypothetical protein
LEGSKIMAYKKKNKRDKVSELSTHDMDGNLEDVISKLIAVKEDREEYFNFQIETDTEYGYYNDSWTVFNIYAFREETDSEFEKRVEKSKRAKVSKKASDKKIKEEKEASEKKEFIRLSKKFKCNLNEKSLLVADFQVK